MIRLTKEELRALAATDPKAFVEVREKTHFLRGTTAGEAFNLVERREIPCAEMSEYAYESMTLGLPYAAAIAREFASQQNPKNRGPLKHLAWVIEASLLIGPCPMRPAIIDTDPTPENHERWSAAHTTYLAARGAWHERAEKALPQ